MNAKISVFLICVEAIIYVLLYNLHDCTFKQQCLTNHLSFTDSENINLGMLNKSGLHLNENGTKRSVNNFCFSMTK